MVLDLPRGVASSSSSDEADSEGVVEEDEEHGSLIPAAPRHSRRAQRGLWKENGDWEEKTKKGDRCVHVLVCHGVNNEYVGACVCFCAFIIHSFN